MFPQISTFSVCVCACSCVCLYTYVFRYMCRSLKPTFRSHSTSLLRQGLSLGPAEALLGLGQTGQSVSPSSSALGYRCGCHAHLLHGLRGSNPGRHACLTSSFPASFISPTSRFYFLIHVCLSQSHTSQSSKIFNFQQRGIQLQLLI